MSGLLVATILPASLGAPLAGLIVDRLPNRRLMQGAQLLQAAMMVVISLALDNIVAVLLAMVVLGCGSAVADPAAAALIAKADPGNVARGYSWVATVRSGAYILGTALGGILVVAIGAHAAILIDAAAYFAQALLLLLLTVERDPSGHDRKFVGGLDGPASR